MGRKENLANARNIFSEIMQKISNDKEEWKEFFRFSSKFYKYSFTENLLMYAQNKDVTIEKLKVFKWQASENLL